MANFRMDHRATFREGLPYPPSTLHSVEEFTEGALTLIEEVEEDFEDQFGNNGSTI